MLGGTSTAVPKREPCMAVQRRILHSGGWHHISTFRLLCGSGRGDVGCGLPLPIEAYVPSYRLCEDERPSASDLAW